MIASWKVRVVLVVLGLAGIAALRSKRRVGGVVVMNERRRRS
ncbi:hypothetical protein ACFOLD_06760 [Kocuria carniphila]